MKNEKINTSNSVKIIENKEKRYKKLKKDINKGSSRRILWQEIMQI